MPRAAAKVLGAVGDAVQRAAVPPVADFFLRVACARERLLTRERDDGIELAAVRREPLERELRQKKGRRAPAREELSGQARGGA